MVEGYTPGPWNWVRDAVPEGHVQITVYSEETGARVATAFEAEANAELIAASPELLEAAKCLGGGSVYLEEFGRYCFCSACQINDDGPHTKPFHSSSCDDLNRAISKAGGGVPAKPDSESTVVSSLKELSE
jgi:predicted Zn-dependent protease